MIRITRRQLTSSEIKQLISNIKKFTTLTFVSHRCWQSYRCIYVIEYNKKIAGACAIIDLKNWVKLGPIVILDKYQGKGYGKKLLARIVSDHLHKNIYIGSPNYRIWKIVNDLGFKRIYGFYCLPIKIIFHYIVNIEDWINIIFLKEFVRKLFMKKMSPYYLFVKTNIISQN